jgi:hypothetical protein
MMAAHRKGDEEMELVDTALVTMGQLIWSSLHEYG